MPDGDTMGTMHIDLAQTPVRTPSRRSRRAFAATTLLATTLAAGVLLGACASARTTAPTSTAPTATAPTSTAPTTGVTTAPATATPTPATPATPATTGIPVGPGPQSTYTVQAQPVPGSCRYTYVGADPRPDPTCTPGATNPEVTQATLGTTICAAGYTATIRPPVTITAPEKRGSAAAYGYTGSFHTGEYDHLIPLELGGDPNAAANLWLEPNDNPAATSAYNGKDTLENKLKALVCAGSLSLAAAQSAIATNWVAAAQKYGN